MIISSTNAFILQHRVHINLKKNKAHLTLNTKLAVVAILNQRVLLQTLALETARVWIIIRMIRSAMTNDTEHRSHLSGSNDERQIMLSR